MKTLPRVVLSFVFLQSVASSVAWACKCDDEAETPEALLDAHGKVFVGEVLDGPHGRGCGSGRTDTYTLEITEGFKGVAVGDTIALETAASGSSCDMGMEVGEVRLVYTNDDTVSLCGPGGRAADNADDIEALRAAVVD